MVTNNKSRVMMGLMGVMVLGALLFTAIASVDADAAKGSNGARGGKPAPAPTATLTVSPNSPTGGQAFIVSGTGFSSGAPVNFVLGSKAVYAMANQSGYAASTWTIALAGTYTISAKELTSKGWVPVGSITFNVQ